MLTVKELMKKIKHSGIGFSGSKRCLRRCLHKMGFKWKKTEDSRKLLIEQHDVRLLRTKYITTISEYCQEDRPVIYIEETYINSSHTKSVSWNDIKSNLGLKKSVSKGL